MFPFTAEAHATAASPATLLEKFREHMVEHGLEVQGPLAATCIAFPEGRAMLHLKDGVIALRIEAATPDILAEAKATVSGHLEAFAPGEALGIAWAGARTAGTNNRPHNFRATRVLRVADVTPRMRRVTLRGPELARFDAEMLHVKILIPDENSARGADGEPAWPSLAPNGQASLDGCALVRRTYTIRRIDAAAGELDIDFVLHGEGSPGSRFAAKARPGDWLGLTGPGGGHVPLQGWTLIAGDETALPAIARALETMPREARGRAVIEVANAAEQQFLDHPPGFELHWLPRDGAACGARLLEAVLNLAWPEEEVSAWAACEAETARQLRDRWAAEPRLAGRRFRAAAYWRQGAAEGTAPSGSGTA
ncbi:siderophore-interacting protein [Teichococcus vastitatis]|uniref:Siderophore-interacting protein n=1 Tax=Teichococcus vastitatis TaxID=2307076 RepID=A0ABS9WCQ9_9PROT|nr:siderophore-interacting protein [Pseudoroseomonas vastitatis]MCI0757096.1 siderophore-interacting protein [Pseudoroseomonas vastitatis]